MGTASEARINEGHVPLRVAFLTPEYPSENESGGGVGSYVHNMAHLLRETGHLPEVFVLSTLGKGDVWHDGVRVERVDPNRSALLRGGRGLFRLATMAPSAFVIQHIADARRLGAAFAERERHIRYDVVQSSNYTLSGLFVRPHPHRLHLVRLSTSRLLWDAAHGIKISADQRCIERLDHRIMKQADAVYAPSRFLADHVFRSTGREVSVIRPPRPAIEHLSPVPVPIEPPPRFMLHFGVLGPRKGSDMVARALVEAWRQQPDLKMVWVGNISPELLAEFRALWGDRADHVVHLPSVERPVVYSLLRNALASVLPSRADNLPNTVIESLALNTPVIAMRGASLDEIVEPGRSGQLVETEDVCALAEAMVDAWQGRAAWANGAFVRPRVFTEMEPQVALDRFMALVRQLQAKRGIVKQGGRLAIARPSRNGQAAPLEKIHG